MSIEQDHHWHVNGAYAGLALLEPRDKRLYDGAYANSNEFVYEREFCSGHR